MNMYKKTLLVLVAILAFGTAAMSQNNIVYPYNPDVDTDGYISTIDLLELLGLYSSEFTVGEIFVDGVSLGEVMINFQQLISATSSSGTTTGEFLRWNNENENWEPELVLNDLQINDMTVNEDAIFLNGVTIDGDVGVNGALGASSVVVQSNLMAGSASLQGLNVNGATGLDGSLTVTSNTNLNNLNVSGNALIEGTLSVNEFESVVVVNNSLGDDPLNIENYPLQVKGSSQGVYIELDPIGSEIDGDQHFITFSDADQNVLGRVEGNQSVSALADLISSVVGIIGGSASASFIESCPWTLTVNSNNVSQGDLLVFVQRGAATTFPEEFNDGGGGCNLEFCDYGYCSSSAGSNGACQDDDCYRTGRISLQPGSTTLSFYVPSSRNIWFSYAPSGDGFDTDLPSSSPLLNFSWTLTKPSGETINGNGSSLGSNDWFGLFCGNHSYMVSSGESCPETDSESGSEDLDAPDANQNQFLTAGGNPIGDIAAGVDELVMIAEWAKSLTELVVSIFPPGILFDGFDILDATFGVVTSSWGVASYYMASTAAIGIAFESGGADYAEWLEKAYLKESLVFGDVVGVKGGKISKSFVDADHYMVISSQPIIIGNMPKEEGTKNFEKVAFLGQAPVKVRGKVRAGDYVVASGHGDGIAIAIKPEEMKPLDYKRIIGVAWGDALDSKDFGYSLINTAIGLNSNDVIGELDDFRLAIISLQEAMSLLNPDYIPVSINSPDLNSAQANNDALNSFETLRPYLPSGISEVEIEFVEFVSELQVMDDDARSRIANYVNDISVEQMGISIKEDYPIIYNVITDENYALSLRKDLNNLLGEINLRIKSIEDSAEALLQDQTTRKSIENK